MKQIICAACSKEAKHIDLDSTGVYHLESEFTVRNDNKRGYQSSCKIQVNKYRRELYTKTGKPKDYKVKPRTRWLTETPKQLHDLIFSKNSNLRDCNVWPQI